MKQKAFSPRITHLSWGRMEVEGQDKPFKDAKIFPGGAREWNWKETGTQHVPGIQPADVEELLEHGATEVILSKGVYERLQVCPETVEMLKEKGISTHVLQTEKAVQLYNELREKKRVGGLFHSTC
ncbi:MAG TPA: Mth938-like domain-containing protein [Thermodesulfobacteriota bacterium]|nr:Mth938-like domain-containing protein [Thermodesulfobacteriota bacterium]